MTWVSEAPKFEPGLARPRHAVPDPAQVAHDVGAVTEEVDEERRVRGARDEPQHPVTDAVEPVDLARDEEPAQKPRHGGDVDQPHEEAAEEHHRGERELLEVEAAAHRRKRARPDDVGDVGDALQHPEHRRGDHRREHQQVEQLQAAVEEPPDAPAAGGVDTAEVGGGGPRRRCRASARPPGSTARRAATRRGRAGRRRRSTVPAVSMAPSATTASAPIVIAPVRITLPSAW